MTSKYLRTVIMAEDDRLIEQFILSTLGHQPETNFPVGPGKGRSDDDLAKPRFELHILGQLSLFKESLRNANPSRIADLNDASLHHDADFHGASARLDFNSVSSSLIRSSRSSTSN